MNVIETPQINSRRSSLRLTSRPDRLRRRTAGFTITEMLVVVGIIVLLASLLMVAMGRVRTTAMTSQTLSIMQNFAAAADAFQTEHGMYPGVIPERVLATEPATLASGGEITFTGTENALLHLMGGYRVLPPGTSAGTPTFVDYDDYDEDYEITFGTSGWSLKVKLSDIGQGPVINGKPHPPYYTPGTNEVAVARGQYLASDDPDPNDWVRIPDLIDAWGQPIIFIRQIRTSGPLVGDPDSIDADGRPQFLFGRENSDRKFGSMSGYLLSEALGEIGMNQDYVANDDEKSVGSILNDDSIDRLATFAQIIRHPAFGDPENPLSDDNRRNATARGAYVLISAGPDGVFFSAEDGPGLAGTPETNIISGNHGNPSIVDTYDDIRFFGGG